MPTQQSKAGQALLERLATMPLDALGSNPSPNILQGTFGDPSYIPPPASEMMPKLGSMILDFIPGVGDIKSGQEAIMGQDLITGDKLENWQRWLAGLGALPFIPNMAGMIKKVPLSFDGMVKSAGKNIEGKGGFNEMVKKARTGETDITTVEPGKPMGGKSIDKLKREDFAIQDELKQWLNDNVEDWTFKDSREENWLESFRRKEIPADKLPALDAIRERLSNVRKARDERLSDFVNKREISDFTRSELEETISYSDMQKATGWDEIKNTSNPIGPERIYFRYGDIPESGKSYNSMTNSYEKGVSVYVTPQAGSLAGYGDKKIYYGKGRQIGTGGDSEPIIVPSGKWKVFDIEKVKLKTELPSPSRPPESGKK